MNEIARRETVLQVSALTRSYGKGTKAFRAVKGLDFRVSRGEVFGLLGTNGAGKTSTLEILEGLAPASSGEIEVFGRDPFIDKSLGETPSLTSLSSVQEWASCSSQAGFPRN
ncbi:hypothetical protein AZH44_11430 [Corynebacterium striatum]|uniref:ATP-binding cassette domain-containing protein n=1 Tax=Corynebacterium striatum TaxID=43770 RepID=UPI000C590630|nr:hypothetical protein AZH44_11430 [Corynebacterium striatum]